MASARMGPSWRGWDHGEGYTSKVLPFGGSSSLAWAA